MVKVARELDAKTVQKQQKEVERLRKQTKDVKGTQYPKMEETGNPKNFVKVEEKNRLEDENYDLKRQLDQKTQVLANREKTIEELRQKLNVILSSNEVTLNLL